MNLIPLDISVAKAKAASGVKPLGPQADDPGLLEQEAVVHMQHEQTLRLRAARLVREAEVRASQKGGT